MLMLILHCNIAIFTSAETLSTFSTAISPRLYELMHLQTLQAASSVGIQNRYKNFYML